MRPTGSYRSFQETGYQDDGTWSTGGRSQGPGLGREFRVGRRSGPQYSGLPVKRASGASYSQSRGGDATRRGGMAEVPRVRRESAARSARRIPGIEDFAAAVAAPRPADRSAERKAQVAMMLEMIMQQVPLDPAMWGGMRNGY